MTSIADREELRTGSPFAGWGLLRASPALWIVAIAVLLALVLALPGQTVTTRAIEETFLALDGIHRVVWGEVPSRDFHTWVGPLAYYLPTLGYRLTGSYGGAMPLAMGMLTVVMGAIAAHVFSSRLRPVLALLFAGFLLVTLAVPMNLGDGVTALTFGLFYNRIGWVAIAVLLTMYLTPVRSGRWQFVLDAAAATLLLLILVYTRLTYGAVAIAFLIFLLLLSRQRGWAALALAAAAVVAVGIEFFWQGTSAYLADSLMALQAGGFPFRGEPAQIIDHLLGNFADYLLLGILAAFALWKRWSLRDLLFYVFCGLAGFWLINHNEQRWGILAMHAAAVVSAETLLRSFDAQGNRTEGPLVNRAGVQLYFLAFVLPTIFHCVIALGLHAVVATTNGGRPFPFPGMERVRVADLWTPGDFGGSNWYFDTLRDGISALAALTDPGRLFVFPGPNPFSSILDLPPARGDAADLRWKFNLDDAVNLPAESLLTNVDTVLDRVSAGGSGPIGALYMPYVRENFTEVGLTPNWRVFRRNGLTEPATVGPAIPSAGGPQRAQ